MSFEIVCVTLIHILFAPLKKMKEKKTKNELHCSYWNTVLVVVCFSFRIANKTVDAILVMETTTIIRQYCRNCLYTCTHTHTHTKYKAKYHLRNTIVTYLALLSACNSTELFLFFISLLFRFHRMRIGHFVFVQRTFPRPKKLVAFESYRHS